MSTTNASLVGDKRLLIDMQFPGQFIHGFLCWVGWSESGCGSNKCPQNSFPAYCQ
jgi:hypothetical protein